MKKKITFLTLVLCFIGLNVFFALNDIKTDNSWSTIFGMKQAIAADEGGQGTYAKEIECYAERAVTVSGSIATAAGIYVGSVFNDGWAADIKCDVQIEYVDGYVVNCFENSGNLECNSNSWVECKTAHGYPDCPEPGFFF